MKFYIYIRKSSSVEENLRYILYNLTCIDDVTVGTEIDHLQENTTYNIIIRAFTTGGIGPESEVVKIKTNIACK